MHACLLALETQLEDLRNFARFLEAGQGLQSGPLLSGDTQGQQRLRDLQTLARRVSGTAARTLAYNMLIVSMYGALERFMEEAAITYIDLLNDVCPQYSDLPAAIRSAHLDCTVDFMRRIDKPRLSGATDAETLVANLHSCLTDVSGYKVNAIAFASHTANFRSGVVQSFLSRIGINDAIARIIRDPSYRLAYAELDPEGDASVSFFNDLVERRNEVAHGAAPTQLLSLELLRAYIDLVRGFARGAYGCMRLDAIDVIRARHGQALGRPLGVYQSGRIATMDLSSGRVEVGDALVARRKSGLCSAVRIESLRVNDVAVDAAEAINGDIIPLGLGLGGAIRRTYELWVVKSRVFDRVGWYEPDA